jgi:Na+/proline symporter
VVFLLAVLSAILSTIDSAILSPASVLAENVVPYVKRGLDPLRVNRWAVLFVAGCSLIIAYRGEDAYALLEEAYLLTMVGLFVPLILGLYSHPKSMLPAMLSMLVGTGVWAVHFVLGWETFLPELKYIGEYELPLSLSATGCGLLAYFIGEPPWKTEWHWPSRTTEPAPEA